MVPRDADTPSPEGTLFSSHRSPLGTQHLRSGAAGAGPIAPARWWPVALAESLARDLRYAVRSLGRDRGATAFAIGIAGFGIGAGTIVFSLCQALLLRPLPFQEPDRLAWIANGTSENLSAQTVQVSNLQQLREENHSFDGIAGFSPFYGQGDIRLTGTGEPERVTGVPVTQTFFPLLGVQPLLGRFFDDAESRWNAPKTVVLDHGFWQRRFGADPAVVGRSIELDGKPATVIGVLPASIDFAETFTPGQRADVFVPFPVSPETDRQGNTLALVGRLRRGVSLAAAQADAAAIGARIKGGRVGDHWQNTLVPRLTTLRARVSGKFTTALLVLSGAVAFLMLLVCANLSNLLLVRGSGRRREMAVRAALGASARDLVRQLLVESLLLGGAGALLGLLLATGGTRFIARIQGTTIPLLRDVRVDGVVLGFTVLVAVLTSVAVGILPALQATSVSVPTALAEGSRGSTSGRSGWIRRAIVVSEVALVCVLLTGAGLLTRSLLRVLEVQPGFVSGNLLVMRVDPVRVGTTREQRNAYFDAVVREVGGVAGVEALGLTDALPLGDNFGWRRWGASLPGARSESDKPLTPLVRMIDAGYLATMRIPVHAGRGFTQADNATSEPVIIINDQLAAAIFPGQDPLGRAIETSGELRRVVGVVGGVRYFALDRDVEPEMYLPVSQGNFNSMDLVVRGTIPPAALAAGIRGALQRVDPSLPVATYRTMRALVDRSLFARRFIVLLVAGFAVFGLVLSALGIYAVIAYSVSQRTQEIGIRMALGATAGRVRTGILGETGRLVATGVAAGVPLSWMATRAVRGLLYDVGPSDPATFAAVVVILAGVAALAGYLPTRRATRVDPAVALRPR